jgi:choline dehydrogenase
VGFYQVTQRRGRRCSAAVGYLQPASRRANLEILTHCLSHRVLFEGRRAVGVEYQFRGGLHRARAEREVILAAGTIASPQLLMLSGIGRPDELNALGIQTVAESPQVGCNLQDHLDFCTLSKCTQKVSYDFNFYQELMVAARYLLTRSGPGVSNIAEAGGFVRSHLAPDQRPDIQFHFVPAQLDDHGRHRLSGHGYTLHACALRPLSRGHLSLRSSRPEDPPRIFACYLSESKDLEVMLEGIRWSREILHAAAFAPFRGAEIYPGEAVRSRPGLKDILRHKAETIYHPVGSCRMGADSSSVVDCQLGVRGVEGLRVADASVMPRLIGGNTNAPTIMIAERLADMLTAQH